MSRAPGGYPPQMTLEPGTYRLGPDNAELHVRTYREGVASRAGHDLVIVVTQWEATVAVGDDGAPSSLQLTADPRSLDPREGLGGVKPLTDKDRAEIRSNIDGKVLRGQPITFRSTSVRLADGGRLAAEGELTVAGTTRPVAAELAVAADGRVRGTIPLAQTEWGIKPYRGLMGALKVRDEVEIVIDAPLAAAAQPAPPAA